MARLQQQCAADATPCDFNAGDVYTRLSARWCSGFCCWRYGLQQGSHPLQHMRMRGSCRSCMCNSDKLQSCKSLRVVSVRSEIPYRRCPADRACSRPTCLHHSSPATASAPCQRERLGMNTVHSAARNTALTLAQDVAPVDEQHLHRLSAWVVIVIRTPHVGRAACTWHFVVGYRGPGGEAMSDRLRWSTDSCTTALAVLQTLKPQ